MAVLHGIVPAMITPTKDNRVHLEVLHRYTDWLVEHGVHGLFALGTTGEGLLVSQTEWREATRTVVDAAKGRIPVVVQCGGISLEDTIWRLEAARQSGVDGVALMSPFFYAYSDEDVERYYDRILGLCEDVTAYLYNVPKYTGHKVSAEGYGRLWRKHGHLRGMKDSSGSAETLRTFVEAAPEGDVLSGSDANLVDAYAAGAKGIVSGVAAALPGLAVAAWADLEKGSAEGADRMKQVRDAFHHSSTIRAARAVLEAQGLPVGPSLQPLPPISGEARRQLHDDMQSLGIQFPSR